MEVEEEPVGVVEYGRGAVLVGAEVVEKGWEGEEEEPEQLYLRGIAEKTKTKTCINFQTKGASTAGLVTHRGPKQSSEKKSTRVSFRLKEQI